MAFGVIIQIFCKKNPLTCKGATVNKHVLEGARKVVSWAQGAVRPEELSEVHFLASQSVGYLPLRKFATTTHLLASKLLLGQVVQSECGRARLMNSGLKYNKDDLVLASCL